MPGGRVAEVAEDKAPAWVGAANDQVSKLLYQTELSVSQSVSILDEAYRTEGGAKKLWFKIAPPQGEFRWVRSSMLGTEPITAPKKKSRAASALANKSQSSDEASQGVAKASYQSPVSKNPPKDGESEGNLAWSDEAEQVARVEREIRREQEASEQKIRQSAPSGAKKGSLIKRSPAGPAEVPVERTGERPADREVVNGLGMFGMSLVDPSQIPGHPKQSAGVASGPRDGAIYSPSSPVRSVPRSAIASRPARQTGPAGGAATGTGSSYAGIEHLPRPTGRYSSTRSSGGYPRTGGPEYFDRDALDREGAWNEERMASGGGATGRPWWKTQGPLFGGQSEMGSDTMLAESRSEMLGDEALGDGSASRGLGSGSMMLASGPSMRSSASDSGSNWRSSDEVDRFQTPAIQDALAELSMIVSRPVDQWNLAPLRDSAMQWIERGETPLIRGEARLLLDRIERFELLRQRTGGYVAPAAMGPQIPMTSNASYQVERSPSMQSELTGWLVAVHTSLPGQPEFALTDDVGNVKAYVQPTTGLNLRRYTQQLVTVYGPQGYLPTLGAKQIVADRVVRTRQ